MIKDFESKLQLSRHNAVKRPSKEEKPEKSTSKDFSRKRKDPKLQHPKKKDHAEDSIGGFKKGLEAEAIVGEAQICYSDIC